VAQEFFAAASWAVHSLPTVFLRRVAGHHCGRRRFGFWPVSKNGAEPCGAENVGYAAVSDLLNVGKKTGVAAIDCWRLGTIVTPMKGTFTAIIEAAPEGGYWAICPEVPGANGQGETVAAAKKSLREAIKLIFEDRVEDARRGLPEDAIQTVVAVG